MWLFLDPRGERVTIKVGIMESGESPRFFEYDRRKENSLLGFIVKQGFISCRGSRCKKHCSALRGIVVVPGPGSFSAVRTTAGLANSIAFARKTPIVSVISKKGETEEQIFKRGVKLINSGKTRKFIKPLYGKEPNITI